MRREKKEKMMMREKISGRSGRRLEENWRERLPKKWERERGRAELERA